MTEDEVDEDDDDDKGGPAGEVVVVVEVGAAGVVVAEEEGAVGKLRGIGIISTRSMRKAVFMGPLPS